MGCSESKIDNVTIVNQFKERIAFMKQSVLAHASFVSAHHTYAATLKNTGAALCDYAQSELQDLDDRPPPSHPPNHSVCPPQQENEGTLAWDFFIMLMEDVNGPNSMVTDTKLGRIEKPVIRRKAVKNPNEHGGYDEVVEDMKGVNFLKVFREVDDGFIKAFESACEVSMFHDAKKLHCHSNFADNQGQIKHSTKVMNIINGAKVDFSSKEKETHAILLDKMLAWEKRLYNQVKACETMKYGYHKKMALLTKHRKRGVNNNILKQAEATVNHLHTTYTVEMQSIGLTVSEINRLRDQHLFPNLVQIVEEMGEMWKKMQKQHEQQLTIVQGINNIKIKISQLPKNTSDLNLKNIEKLHLQVMIWCYEFEKLMLHQKEYVRSLTNWLKLNLTCIDHNVIKSQNTKIELLLRTWNDKLHELSEEEAKTAIRSFGYVIVTIVKYHEDEMKMKERCDEIRREIMRKTRKFEEWCDKQIAKRMPSDEMDVDVIDDMDVIMEQQVVMNVLKRRLEEEEEVYRRYRVHAKDMALVYLAAALPEVFAAMEEFCGACSRMYESLK